MKKILLTIALLLFMFSCTTEEEYPDPPETIEVGLSFNRFINIQTSSFGRSAAEWEHILSPSARAIITITNIDKTVPDIEVNRQFSDIANTTLSLEVGTTYIIDLTYTAYNTDTTGIRDNGLAFKGNTGHVLIMPDTQTIELICSTNESLVLIDKEGLGTTIQPKFADGSINADSTGRAWLMFDSPLFWFVYLEPIKEQSPLSDFKERFLFQYSDSLEHIVNVSIPTLSPETIYLISEVEAGNITLTYDYDEIFGDLIVVGVN